MARSKRTPENRAKIIQGLKLGMTYKLAAQYAGMSTQTLWDWISKDPDFSDACKDAEGHNAAQALATIIKAAREGNWTAGAWLLERRHGYTKTEKIEHAGTVKTVRIDLSDMEAEELDKLAEAALVTDEQRVH
jgi:hypothetical protein